MYKCQVCGNEIKFGYADNVPFPYGYCTRCEKSYILFITIQEDGSAVITQQHFYYPYTGPSNYDTEKNT